MEQVSIEHIRDYINGICSFEHRLAGSDKERQTAEYIKSQLSDFGYEDIKEYTFDVYGWFPQSCSVEVVAPEHRELKCAMLPYSNSVSVETELVTLNHVDEEQQQDRTGKIALAPWGQHLYLSAMRTYYIAQRQNLSAVLISSPNDGNLRKVVVVEVGGEMDLPLISISKEDGTYLSDLLSKGDVRIKIGTKVDIRPKVPSQNLEVVLNGKESDSQEIVIGAHYDAYFKGAADNAAPAAIMLELARVAKKHVNGGGTLKRTLRFLFFGAEECGSTSYYYWINGSRAFVEANQELMKRASAMLSLDSIGYHASNYITSTLELTELAKKLKVPMKNRPNVVHYSPPAYGSDHWFFEISGVPTLYGVTFPSPLYHTQKDDMEHLDMNSVQFYAEFMREAMVSLTTLPVLPHDIFTPLERFSETIQIYRKIENTPFDLGLMLRRIERIIRERKAFNRIKKKVAESGDKDKITELNSFILSTVNFYNKTIGWVWRKSAPSDVSYLSKLELIADYVELSSAISYLRKLPISNLDPETVHRYRNQKDNPFNWVDIHDPLEKLENERARMFRVIEDEISRMSKEMDSIYEKLKVYTG